MTLANYPIVDRICTTTGSCLYRASGLKDGTLVMLKRLAPQDTSAAQTACFRREYLLLQSLNIPELVKPIALIDEGGCLAMVVEDCAGESLEAFLAGDHRMDLPTCLAIASHLSHAMAAMHAAQVIHQDIRPLNILVTPDNQIRIMDMTIAIAQEREAVSSGQCAAHMVDWAYMSPEQTGRMNHPLDYRTDFYSLGIMLYRMLTGALPFAANDALEWAHCHIARLPPPASEIALAIPEAVSNIVMKLLAKLPEDRYQSAHGLQVDLERCLAQWQLGGRIDPFPLGTEDVSDRFHIPHKLYGRDQETAILLTAFDRMAATGDAALVTVSGYSGIGKSSLVHELHKPIVCERGYFMSGKFDQFMRDIPYATLTQAFRELVQQLLAESETRIAGWRQRIQAAVGVNGQLIVDVLPQVEFIIGQQAPVPALPPTEAQNRFRLVFQQFIAVFTRKEHPLVLFLDDVQWADAASLQLIEHLLTHPDTRYLLLIAAYRANEVSAAHPLMATLDAIRHSDAAVIDIRLAPLAAAHLNQLVADTLHAPFPSCEPLTQLVFERTEGNPFFFTQFLDSLHTEGLLQHDPKSRVWQWDLAQIQTRDFADNVADLMAGKLRRLPEPTQEVLQLAACLGNKFDLRHLALVSRLSEDEVKQHLSAAIHQGLLIQANGSGKFLHDRIQQAAYSLIPEERRAEVHLRIGRTLTANLTAHEIDVSLFDVANQFNRGAALLTAPDEKAQVAEIDRRAGCKAKAAIAYGSACVYLAAGMALLDESDWDSQYELMFSLWFERAECEFLSSHFDEADRLIARLLQHAASKVDQAAAYCLKIALHVMKSENPQAVDSALACLHLFGIDMPARPNWGQVQAEYEKLWQNLGERQIEDLIDLPMMSDPEMQAAMDVFAVLLSPALFTDQKLYYQVVGRMANISLKHGNSAGSCLAYVWLGGTLGPAFGDYRAAFRFGKLGVDLVEQRGLDRFRAKIYLAFGNQVNPWNRHMRSARVWVQRAFDTAKQSGDLICGAYSCNNLITNRLVCGDPLDEIQRAAENGLEFARKARFGLVVDFITAELRLIRTLRGLTPDFSSFNDDEFDERRFEQHFEGHPSRTLATCWYWIRKLQARFYAGDYQAAIETALKAQRLLWTSASFFELAEYHFYAALARAAHYDAAAADERPQYLAALSAHHRQIEVWAENCPDNFQNRAALVSAEIARLEGREPDAMRLYEKAIQSARENGFVQNEGIAHELAAQFCLTRGYATAARAHLADARSCFARWGADGKVRQLDARYPQLRAQPASHSAVALSGGVAQLDLLSVAKASQAISGRIVLDQLIDTLMRIVLENAGAQTGYLLLARGDDLVLAAEASVAQQTVQVRRHLGQALPESVLPMAILNYVRRSQAQMLLADATKPHPFAADPYLARHQPKSVLCLPIVRQTTLIGLLYLENTLVTHAFTPQRVTVLELLASQAAISLENALLYTDLQQENSERKRVEDTLREREARIRRLMESNIIGIFFWDLQGGISEANDAFLRLVGYDRQELLSGQVQWAQMTPPEYVAADARAIEELRHTGTCSTYEKAFVRKDGTRLPVLLGAALLEGSQENGVAFVLDLTERKQAETERAARQAADTANRAKSTFLANMSHELRTPLNGILGYAQILQRDQTLGERQRAGVNVIRQSGDHLLTLINDILDFAKIEAGKWELNPTCIPLADFLHVLAEIINVKAEQKGLDFISDIAPDLPSGIRADERLLRQVLLNLLANAVKFTDCGQVMLRVRWLPPARLRFEVRDTGIGISEGQLKTLFQPFEQAGEMQRRFGGTGLGLAISRQIVRLMGSEIEVDSRAGQGSTFWFELEVPVLAAERVAVPLESVVTGYEGPRKKVLVVDDVAENRAVVVDMLGALGFEMVEAANGRDGVEKAQILQPELILMDRTMPEMNGLEATRRLRQLPTFKDVPIIAISASASCDDEASSLAAGANVFLPKPVDLERLLTQIAALLKLNWIYALPQRIPVAEQEAAGPLLTPLPEEMKALHRLARLGNMSGIAQWASRLAERDERYRPFADRLHMLAKGYQSKAILTLVERYLDST